MIKKIIIVCVILLCFHSLYIFKYNGAGYATNQWQSNIIKTQDYLFGNSKQAVVGTSLSARIIPDSLPSDVAIVSFGGCSAEDGLNLIKAKSNKPEVVYIETNLLSRESTTTFVKDNTDKYSLFFRNKLPFLQERYQPICLIADMLLKLTHVNPQIGSSKVDVTFLNNEIDKYLDEHKTVDLLKERIRLKCIRNIVTDLQTEGCKIVFFEMPMNPRLRDSDFFNKKREILEETFPHDKYLYMNYDNRIYLTTDGMHLEYSGQQRFSKFFSDNLIN